jgi:hypothetical protein
MLDCKGALVARMRVLLLLLLLLLLVFSILLWPGCEATVSRHTLLLLLLLWQLLRPVVMQAACMCPLTAMGQHEDVCRR